MAKATTTNCRKCHGLLTNPRSVAAGIGPVCARKERQEAAARTAGFKPAAIEKARQLIADRAIVPVRGRHIFRAVSSDGTRTYLTAKEACTCAAGLKGKHVCFHRVAVTLLAA